MMQSYRSAKVWLTVQMRYEPANPRDQKNKSFEFYLTCAATRFFRREPTEGNDGALYAEQSLKLFEQIKKLNATFIREQSGLVLATFFSSFSAEYGTSHWRFGVTASFLLTLKPKQPSSTFKTQMIDALVTLFCGFLTYLAIEYTETTHHCIRNKCLNEIILPIFLTPYLQTMSISMKTNVKLMVMCSRSLMIRTKLGTRFVSVENYTQEQQICYTGMSIMLRSPTFPVGFMI